MKNLIKSTFCGVETVSCVSGIPADRIYQQVEDGKYLWVWNVSTGAGTKRELRFWSREIDDRATVTNLTLNAVIDSIIPKRATVPGQEDGLHNWEFRHLLRLSKSSICELRDELGVSGKPRDLFITRANLEKFLRRRWLGNINLPETTLESDPTL